MIPLILFVFAESFRAGATRINKGVSDLSIYNSDSATSEHICQARHGRLPARVQQQQYTLQDPL